MDGRAGAERDESDGAACAETTKDGRKERTNERTNDDRMNARRDEMRRVR
jgi:hypothetical protein